MSEFDDIDLLRIKRGVGKVCRCDGMAFIVDPDCRRIYCNTCGAEVDPFDACYRIAAFGQRYFSRVNELVRENAKQTKLNVRSTLFLGLESEYNGKNKMYPLCPRCREPFAFEELTSWTCAGMAEPRIREWQKKRKEEDR